MQDHHYYYYCAVVEYLYLKKIVLIIGRTIPTENSFSELVILGTMELSRRPMGVIVRIPSAVGLILAGERFNASDIMLSQCG